MLRRVNPIVLFGLVIVLVLSGAIFATARSGGGTAGDAVGVGEAQVGKPFVMGMDGPGSFSCTGLMRYILRTTGVDANAPWSPEGYLGTYTPVAPGDLQPGDIVIYPGWATMYVGNGMVLNANEMEGFVTHTPMSVAGEPSGIVRPPYGGSGQSQPEAINPLPTETTEVIGPLAAEQQYMGGPLAAEQQYTGGLGGITDPLAPPINQVTGVVDPLATGATGMVDPLLTEPTEPLPLF